MNGQTQAEAILEHLRAGGSITPLDALTEFGCFRLAARIYDLRRAGVAIEEEAVTLTGGKTVARYRLAPPRPPQATLGL
jgi:Helix-turn-helix domain